MERILITGMGGVVGSRLLSFLPDTSEVTDLFHSRPFDTHDARVSHVHIDLRDQKDLFAKCVSLKPTVIVHLAAIAHIDTCEKDHLNGKNGEVWSVNVDATQALVEVARSTGAMLIFMSSECVFGGDKSEYDELSKRKPRNWYGVSKAAAEQIIIDSGIHAAIVRSVVTYHDHDNGKTIYGKLLKSLANKKSFAVVSDQKLTPTHTDDICAVIGSLIKTKKSGIFHIAPDEQISPYAMAVMIAKKHGYDASLVVPVTMKSFFREAAADLRLRSACLCTIRATSELGCTARDFSKFVERLV